METTMILRHSRRSGDVRSDTTVSIFSLGDGFLVERATLVKRAHDGALLRTGAVGWHLDDDSERRALVGELESGGFQPLDGRTPAQRLVDALFSWL